MITTKDSSLKSMLELYIQANAGKDTPVRIKRIKMSQSPLKDKYIKKHIDKPIPTKVQFKETSVKKPEFPTIGKDKTPYVAIRVSRY